MFIIRLSKRAITGLIIFTSIVTNSSYIANNNVQTVDAAKTVKKLSPNSKYPNIKSKYDVTNMAQYSGDNMFDSVTLNKFYVKNWGYNKYMGERHLLLTPTEKSNQYFLVVTKTKKVFVGDRITVQGGLNGKGRINHAQIKVGISKKYKNKPATLVLADKVAIYHTK